MNQTDEIQYWIAAEGAVIDGPVALRDAAARYAVGHYPKGAMIKEHGDSDWMPLTPATLRCPMRSEPVPAVPVQTPPVVSSDSSEPLTNTDLINLFAAVLIIGGVFAMVIILNMDVGVDGPTKSYASSSEPEFRIANLHAMHRQSIYLMTAIASLLSGILIVTRSRK